MINLNYALTPFICWLITGSIKFMVNSIKMKRFGFDLIGYGGFPSNHSAIVSSITSLVAIKQGIDSPAFGIALTFAFIVVMDAYSLRRQIGKQAKLINKVAVLTNTQSNLRERMGHSFIEIIAGIMIGACIGTAMAALAN